MSKLYYICNLKKKRKGFEYSLIRFYSKDTHEEIRSCTVLVKSSKLVHVPFVQSSKNGFAP